MSSDDRLPIKYIFRRERWVDRIYGSGLEFTTGQTRVVPRDLGLKLLRHTDTFTLDIDALPPLEPTEAEQTQAALDAAAKEKEEEARRQDELFAMHDSIDAMDKAALSRFVSDKFQLDLDQSLSIDDMRIEAKALIDRFGPT